MRAQAGSQPATNEYGDPNITPHPNTNEYGETREDIITSLKMTTIVTKSTEQAAGSHQSDVGHQSLDHVGHHVVREQVSTKALLFVILCHVCFPLLCTITALPLYHILTFTF